MVETRWHHYIAYFFGGAFLINSVPHLVAGVSGSPFQTPFASPPGEGLSSSTVNVLWAAFNLFAAYLLLRRIGNFELRQTKHVVPIRPRRSRHGHRAGSRVRAPTRRAPLIASHALPNDRGHPRDRRVGRAKRAPPLFSRGLRADEGSVRAGCPVAKTSCVLLCRKPMLAKLAKQGGVEIRIYDGWQQPANLRSKFS